MTRADRDEPFPPACSRSRPQRHVARGLKCLALPTSLRPRAADEAAETVRLSRSYLPGLAMGQQLRCSGLTQCSITGTMAGLSATHCFFECPKPQRGPESGS
jgi:hypothetical protein